MKNIDLHDVKLNSAQRNPGLAMPKKPKSLPLSAQRGPKSWLRYPSLGVSLPRLGLSKISESGLTGPGGTVRVMGS